MTSAMGPFTTIQQIVAANKAKGAHFFAADTMRYWNSTILPEVYGGRYFLTHEAYIDPSDESGDQDMGYAIRRADDDGSIDTIGDRYVSKAQAVSALSAMWPQIVEAERNRAMTSPLAIYQFGLRATRDTARG